jgi:hypothetical protein
LNKELVDAGLQGVGRRTYPCDSFDQCDHKYQFEGNEYRAHHLIIGAIAPHIFLADKVRMVAMIVRSELALVVVVAVFGFASSASAQAFNPDDGSGTALPTYYGPHGGLHTGTAAPQNEQVAGHQSGLNAFAQAPSPSGTGSIHRYNPSLTGGGSAGYNSMYSQDGSAQTLAH